MNKHLLLLLVLLAGGLVARAQGPVTWQFDSARALTELWPATRYLAHSPWLSPDGKRLYFGGSGTPMVAHRAGLGQQFGAPQPVPGLPVDAFVRYSDDELTAWYTYNHAGPPGGLDLYRATRPNDSAAFGPATPITLVPRLHPHITVAMTSMYYGPTVSEDGQELYLTWCDAEDGSALMHFRQAGVDTFAYQGDVALPGLWAGTAQLFDHDHRLLVSVDTTGWGMTPRLYVLERNTTADPFAFARRVLLPVLDSQGIEAQPMVRPELGALALIRPWRQTYGNLWLLEGAQMLGLSSDAGHPGDFTLAPNPAHGTVHLRGTPAGPLQLLDALGRVVRSSQFAVRSSPLDLTGLPPGFYTVRCGTQARRLVVEQ